MGGIKREGQHPDIGHKLLAKQISGEVHDLEREVLESMSTDDLQQLARQLQEAGRLEKIQLTPIDESEVRMSTSAFDGPQFPRRRNTTRGGW